MTTGTASKTPHFPFLIPALIALIACLAWAALTPQGEEAAQIANDRTAANLQRSKEAIQEFERSWQDVPTSMAELRAFARAQNLNILTFDAFGNRLDYIRLSNKNFLLRSFGSDDRQTSVFSDADPYVASWSELPNSTPRYRYLHEPTLSMYPTPLILGSYSPNQNWYAQIFSDRDGGSRRLVVRNPQKDRFLIASHDLVEEFLWLPNSYQIIYTATSSPRYLDGLFLWNILTDETINLLDSHDRAPGLYPDNRERKYFLSLAGANVAGDKILAYIAPDSGDTLNPVDFLNKQQFYEITLPSPGVSTSFKPADNFERMTPLHAKLHIGSGINGEKQNDAVYREWLTLSFEGNLEEVIHNWQKFAESHANSPILPYCLWYLSSIYSDAQQLVKPISKEDAAILSAYGAELAEALSQLPSSPSYLRAFGNFIYESLTAEVPLPYQISRLELPPKKDKGG
jgi:hypothetical protein